ncbi:MAG TPA: hypothetical protein H9875_04680 [Candidatus Levilactobacillus faecigallinarum]|uniref:Uncharacterized protein n=1 Tax=Candidatus Levilactobacillus faecigallinarum TaxID=2838638 RepID=A0A9D1QTM6_9LACO|nr:hypothetical protein [Candidatus Levilactobacillus faecigallinarum]
MSAHDWQPDDEQPKTRADYRREQEAAGRAFEERDRKRVAVERKYAREHPDSDDGAGTDDEPPVVTTTDAKQQRLKRRLNWAIFWLALGIIAVFLILRFVEF